MEPLSLSWKNTTYRQANISNEKHYISSWLSISFSQFQKPSRHSLTAIKLRQLLA